MGRSCMVDMHSLHLGGQADQFRQLLTMNLVETREDVVDQR